MNAEAQLRNCTGLSRRDFARLSMAFVVALAGLWSTPPLTHAQDSKSKGEAKSLRTRDGATIRITYFPAKGGKDSPVVVLIPDEGGNRIVYDRLLAPRLHAQDMAVITFDPRFHGESSGGPADPNNTDGKQPRLTPAVFRAVVTQDLEAIKGFIFEEHQAEKLNMAKMGLVAPASAAAIAVAYAELDWSKKPYDDAPVPAARTPRGQDVKAIVMISPETTIPGLSLNRSLGKIVNGRLPISFLVIRGEDDPEDRGQVRRVMQQLSAYQREENSGIPVALEASYPVKLHGVEMLGKNLPIEQHIAGFFDKYLKNLPISWRNRRSPLFGEE